jgi:L-asparaginase
VRGYLHAVSVAREVMRRLPHVLLVGAGAERFAAECGAERAEMLTAAARRRYERWLSRNVAAARRARLRRGPLAGLAWKSTKKAGGTVVCLARDRQGNIAAATSTSGWAYRYPGRVGDSPIIGAGLYADSRYGACGCTHVGEMTIRAATARSVVLYLKQGMSLESAVKEAMRDLSDLRGGLLGAVTIHAMDRDGRTYAAANRLLGRKLIDHRWQEGMNGPERFRAEVLKGTG